MKKLFSPFFFLFFCTIALGANWNFTIGDYRFYSNGTKYLSSYYVATVIGYSGNSDTLSIPTSVVRNGETFRVTGIGTNAFKDHDEITHIIIPQYVSKIEGNPFAGCSNLKSIVVAENNGSYDSRDSCNAIIEKNSSFSFVGDDVIVHEKPHLITGCQNTVIPSSVIAIGSSAFEGCSNLTGLVFPDSISVIEYGAFRDCIGVSSLELPKHLTSIENYAFQNCSSLTSVIIPENVENIGECAFYGCAKISSIKVHPNNNQYDSRNDCDAIIRTSDNRLELGCINTIIPQDITSIGKYAFSNIVDLFTIDIPSNVTSIGDYAFYGCRNMTSIIIPQNVDIIGNGAFEGCLSLTDVELPDILISINANTFRNCRNLKEIHFPLSVEIIEESAFAHCDSLKSVVLNPKIITVADSAFKGCSNVVTVKIPQSLKSLGASVFEGCDNVDTLIFDNNNIDAGIAGRNFKNSLRYAVLGENYTGSLRQSFKDCANLTEVTILGEITKIDEDAFCNCNNLRTINIPESVTEIGYKAFSHCYDLQSIEIPPSVKKISQYAFYECKSLTELVIPYGVENIYDNAFSYCTGLKKLEVPIGTKMDGLGTNYDDRKCSFYGCSNIVKLKWYTDSDIRVVTWSCKDSLEEVELGDNITTIPYAAFSGCASLSSLKISPNITAIGEYAFAGCSSLDSLIIPSGVKNIKKYTFRNCSRLKYIYIPNANYIEGYAFSGCKSLKSFVIPNGVEKILKRTFENCDSLRSIEIPSSVTLIEREAFYICPELKEVICRATNCPKTEGFDCFPRDTYYNGVLYVYNSYINNYKNTSSWMNFKEIIAIGSRPSVVNHIKDDDYNEKVFDINGMLLPQNKNNKGIYIKEGKKYLVK